MEELAGILGPKQVTFHTQDDKAKVALELPAASKQSPIIMHMEYQVQLPDNDFVVASMHKLIPSVIGDIQIKGKTFSNEAVTYSGAMYIGIRSAKHSGSTAFHHLNDMKRIRSLDEFEGSFKNDEGECKPIMIITVDGGPDENPRYQKTIKCAIDYFNTFDLDGIFIATNAPGRSAFNRCERRMAPLSRELSGVILEHDRFGTHLDNKGNTIDNDLELKNFEHADTVLAEIWSKLVIDEHPVVAEYISDDPDEREKSEKWKSKHVKASQYFLQIVKCNDRTCCLTFRSSYLEVIKDRFLPPPIPIVQTTDGLKWVTDDKGATYLTLCQNLAMKDAVAPPSTVKKYKQGGIPYDYSNPAVNKGDVIKKRICKHCDSYFGTINAKGSHESDCCTNSSPTRPQVHNEEVRVRPSRVKARRGVELLCMMEDNDLEWYDFADVDLDVNLNDVPLQSKRHGTPIMPVEERNPIWAEDNEE